MKIACVLIGAQILDQRYQGQQFYAVQQLQQDNQLELWVLGEQLPLVSFPLQHTIRWAAGTAGADLLPEQLLSTLLGLYRKSKPDCILFAGDILANTLAPLLGYHTNAQILLSVDLLKYERCHLIVQKGVYSQNLSAAFELRHPPFILTIAKSAPVAPLATTGHFCLLQAPWVQQDAKAPKQVCLFAEKSVNKLKAAKRVVIGGRGLGSRQNLALLIQFAESIGAEWGVTRPVFMDGWAPRQRLVGVSGNLLQPELAIVIAASGAAAFMKGIDASKTIIAVNSDPDAPIFHCCDQGIVCDGVELLSALLQGKIHHMG